MADHFISLNRGESGFVQTDFTTGTSSTAADGIELRIKDGAGWTKNDAVNALKAFQRFLETAPWVAAAGIDVKL
ncbi:hypothetical protein M2232_001840 [Bradyrhizobium japonicum]|uniref:hypothetical protein n=1 Tax=Bradyrhizobium japonicum TaxID=375 RepID=UPI002225D641|nr:hypothetical protein [Bradyrhizobium japonicum]MCW2218308.1 hypothetical protein [Bradyrhizobium japonicum]MCW2342922.1 hypothetical protein [Bradyrhizobium japonicum]